MPDSVLDAAYTGPLRSEILESQNTRMNLMKYKRVVAGALGIFFSRVLQHTFRTVCVRLDFAAEHAHKAPQPAPDGNRPCA